MIDVPQFFTYTQEDKENLKKRDATFAQYIDAIGDVKVQVRPDLFSALVHSIIGQQISIKAHATIWDRFVAKVNDLHKENASSKQVGKSNSCKADALQDQSLTDFITAENIILMSEKEIQSCGMTYKKAENILDLSRKIHTQVFNLENIKSMNDKEIIKELCTLKGVGKWTAEMMMLFSMQRPNILSLGDLAIQKGLCIVFDKEKLTKEEGLFYQEKFSPYGSLASLFLWKVVGLGLKI